MCFLLSNKFQRCWERCTGRPTANKINNGNHKILAAFPSPQTLNNNKKQLLTACWAMHKRTAMVKILAIIISL